MAGSKFDQLTPDLFKDGPVQFLVKQLVQAIAKEPHWAKLFGESIEQYDREDFSMRELPALRVYNFTYTKEHESHYIVGDVFLDVILPPFIRRDQLEDVQSQIASALLQQFRRQPFFYALQQVVPGLNELGKVFSVDKTLGFQNSTMEDECPVTHITANFRIDLKDWDEYLESQGRTKEDPFDVTLENLATIATTIQTVRVDADLTTADVQLQLQQPITGGQ